MAIRINGQVVHFYRTGLGWSHEDLAREVGRSLKARGFTGERSHHRWDTATRLATLEGPDSEDVSSASPLAAVLQEVLGVSFEVLYSKLSDIPRRREAVLATRAKYE